MKDSFLHTQEKQIKEYFLVRIYCLIRILKTAASKPCSSDFKGLSEACAIPKYQECTGRSTGIYSKHSR